MYRRPCNRVTRDFAKRLSRVAWCASLMIEVRVPLRGGQPPAVLAPRGTKARSARLHPLRLLRSEGARHARLSSCFSPGVWRARHRRAGPRLAGRGGEGPCFIGGEAPACFGASGAAGLQAGAKLRRLAGACGPFVYGKRDGENSVTLVSAWGDRSAAVATSWPTWCVVATSPPTWCVVSRIRALAWRSEPARLERARLPGAAGSPGGARAPCGPGTRRHRHTRQSLRARQPTARGDEQARGSTRPCRFPKRAQRGSHLHPPSRPPGRPVAP
jgi:hypothetical protein